MATAAQKPASAPAAPLRMLAAPKLGIEWEPWRRRLPRLLREALAPAPPPLKLTSRPAPFWRDVFVPARDPRKGIAISLVYHAGTLAFLYLLPTLILLGNVFSNPQAPRLDTSGAIYYPVSEYLPPMRIAPAHSRTQVARKPQPRLAPQKIISVPLRADNFEQTVIVPSRLRLAPRHIALPNMVVATPVLAPPQSIPGAMPKLVFPLAPVTVIPPTAKVSSAQLAKLKLMTPPMPTPSAIPPAPSEIPVRMGAINMGASPEVEAPKLPVAAQQASGATQAAAESAQASAVPAAPIITGGITSKTAGQLLALNLEPAEVAGPVPEPEGSRHGEFAVGPEGRADAPGTPGSVGENSTAPGSNAPANAAGNLDSITVGAPPASPPTAISQSVAAGAGMAGMGREGASVPLLAKSIPPALPPPRAPESGSIEDEVFAGRKYYSLTLNMPNLSSAGGSWVIRFAQLDPQAHTGPLSAPVALEKVDPAYPPDVVSDHIEGTVTLYAVIASDGSVRDVRVLESVDQRLARSARAALMRWRFHPGMLNGNPVDLEAVVRIPFKLRRSSY